jgi:hypothetical protein
MRADHAASGRANTRNCSTLNIKQQPLQQLQSQQKTKNNKNNKTTKTIRQQKQ